MTQRIILKEDMPWDDSCRTGLPFVDKKAGDDSAADDNQK
jgi:hypothetical protein